MIDIEGHFCVATVWHLGELHITVDELHRKQDEIVQSMNRQITYFKQIDGTVKFHNQAITNLSTTLKELAPQTQLKFQEVESRLEWGDQERQTATTIRELEFALTRLEFSIDEFMDAMQYVIIEGCL
jgi:aminoglycoside N3'-acetyltransferase